MNDYVSFVDQLKNHLDAHSVEDSDQWHKDAVRLVDGLAAENLRLLIDLETRRKYGAFFTNSDQSRDLLENAGLDFSGRCSFYDPAVGAGNLLIAARNASSPIAVETFLMGTDLHQEFIDASSFRISINEKLLGSGQQKNDLQCNLKVADGLINNDYYQQATHVVMNPPFNKINAFKGATWGRGKVSAAAVFVDMAIQYTRVGTYIIAILPDVLRSGSRYEKWRKVVETSCDILAIKLLGQFDKFADVDVFSLLLKKREAESESYLIPWKQERIAARTIKDMFLVSVGNVVDNRDTMEGDELPFVVSRGLERWSEVSRISRVRKFKGKSVKGPFVVIKRTSRMGDSHRAIATIINTNSPVYVDNHLIVVKPNSGTLKDCKFLLKKLKDTKTDQWLDNQIRCRHLTVKIVLEIPI